MAKSDAHILTFEHLVWKEVARLAWNDELDAEHRDALVYKLIPGPRPTYRCCIYKEREIVRQRIRLSCGEDSHGLRGSKNIVQVIKPACDECPLTAYSVTDNCRTCLGKACLSSCKFGAISVGEHRAHIDASKCKECGQCAQNCPYGAIVHVTRPCKRVCPVDAITYDEYGLCHIDEDKCINCGHCIHACPFGAIGSKAYLPHIIRHIKAGDKVYAMCAPATEGQFGADITMGSIRAALKKIGFEDMVEVGLGGDMTAASEAEEWSEAYREAKKLTTSCCPAFIAMQKKHFPQIYDNNMSTTVSPMCAVSRYLKAIHPGCITVFIGPCIAKKMETRDEETPGNADYAITYGEFGALLASKGVELEPVDGEYQEASLFGKNFAGSGGVAAAVVECMWERGEDPTGIKLKQVAGGKECRQALTLLQYGRMQEDFMEGMICPGGCIGGPSKHVTERESAAPRRTLLAKADGRKVLENLEKYPMDQFSMHRERPAQKSAE